MHAAAAPVPPSPFRTTAKPGAPGRVARALRANASAAHGSRTRASPPSGAAARNLAVPLAKMLLATVAFMHASAASEVLTVVCSAQTNRSSDRTRLILISLFHLAHTPAQKASKLRAFAVCARMYQQGCAWPLHSRPHPVLDDICEWSHEANHEADGITGMQLVCRRMRISHMHAIKGRRCTRLPACASKSSSTPETCAGAHVPPRRLGTPSRKTKTSRVYGKCVCYNLGAR